MTGLAGARTSGADRDRIRSEQARALYRNCPVGVISAGVVSVLVAWALRGRGAGTFTNAAAIWSGLVVACAVGHMSLCGLYWRLRPADAAWRRWLGVFTLFAFLEGVVWSFGAVWLTSTSDFPQALVLLLAWTGVCAGGAIFYGPYPLTYMAFFYPAMLPHVYLAIQNRYPMYGLIVALEVAYLIALPLIAWRFSTQLIESARLRFANLDLANDLLVQKERAEQANIAKSSFLAAASHDLRQPVHALTLLIGALRQKRMERDAQRLVTQIDASVASLDELFTSLLDISKLDAGAVRFNPEPCHAGALLRRIRDEFAGEAGSKGVELRLVDCALIVDSDPILVERIVRNLVSNAVRYTPAGRVLLGCRRTGRDVAIEVWDTGPGIPAHHHDLIFQEYFQSGNPERDRAKGLGLGLAIVKRLAGVIGAPLTFHSEVGRGSLFRLVLPRSLSPMAREAPAPAEQPARPGALIAVIDDEAAIRDGMEVLLSGWGYDVVVAASGEQCRDLLSARAARPDLIICDYRLRGAETGSAIIRQLLGHFGDAIPAMLVTGDTAPERIAEAQASGYLLLHKPLANAKLRAAIGNLLRTAASN